MDKFMCLFALFNICGASVIHTERDNRITAGTPAGQNQFPHAVSLQLISGSSQPTRGHKCGGALITLQHVVTTAVCVLENPTTLPPTQIVAAQYRVFAGAANLNNDSDPQRIRSIANFTIHPDFRGPPALNNDIAIITLSAPFVARTVLPLTIPSATYTPEDFSLCSVAGWRGQNLTSLANIELMWATKFIYNQALCTNLYRDTPLGILAPYNITSSMVCAAPYDVVFSGCRGDEGNALICGGEFTGILSVSNYCQTTTRPEVYVRVASYANWLRTVTGTSGASAFQPGFAVLILLTLVHLVTTKVIS